MTASVRLHRLAIKEYVDARKRYSAIETRLGERFEEETDKAIAKIGAHPLSWPVVLQSFRWVRLRRFPFVLYYQVEDNDHVLVLAVAHSRRRWGYWRRRLSY